MGLSNNVKRPPSASFYLLLVALLLIVGTVSAATTFTPFVAYGDAWKSTNDTYTVIKWNATTNLGVRSSWIATNNVTPDTIIEYVVVGGGGGGGGYPGGGGGGAGAYWEGTISGLTGANSITVGPGGNSGLTHLSGQSGKNSILFGNRLDNITANGGSGGGSRAVGGTLVLQGGSAGGGGSPAGAAGTGQTNTSNMAGQGNGGGLGLNVTTTNYQGGGGGSAIGAGKDATSNKGGNAGEATYTLITGTPLVLAGGGGGGTYSNSPSSQGIGGMNGSIRVGGNGSYRTIAGAAAVVNTGSGGGGGGSTRAATAGSGGVIIIRYFTPPVVNNVAPPTGPIAGGTNVKITGTHFTGATAVTMGGTAATSFSVENDTSIIATTPANAAGLVTVAVTTPNGTASATNRYTYVALPTVTSIAPPTGPVAGDTPIIITGTNFIGATNSETSLYNESINGTELTNMTEVRTTSIRASTPAAIAG
ncbi:MAG: IPT/TIG domain-containing protein, partial [Methanoregula sp.]|nr:IPT/TIG domain-containing protein [Methanoregula sp.]